MWVKSTSDHPNAVPACGVCLEAVLWDVKTRTLTLQVRGEPGASVEVNCRDEILGCEQSRVLIEGRERAARSCAVRLAGRHGDAPVLAFWTRSPGGSQARNVLCGPWAPGYHLWARVGLVPSAESPRELGKHTQVLASFLKDLGL